MATPITENWVREKLEIKCDNLEDVRALTLPGSYQDKISALGSALRGFKRLQNLDISRNNLETLEGLEQLKILENLNLYYNNISSLDELYRLRHNQHLVELDLRLNPVTRTEPDYRLFLVHMLPNLRKLDDRSVRDQERKAALLHFDPEQASEFQDKLTQLPNDQRASNARVEYVNDFGSIPAITVDDCHLLDTVANHDYDVTQPRKITGSSATQPSVENYPTKQLLDQVRREALQTAVNNEPDYSETGYQTAVRDYHSPQQGESAERTHLQSKYPNIPPVPADFHERKVEYRPEWNNNQTGDEWEMSSKGHAHFTPHPDGYRDPESYSTHFLSSSKPSQAPQPSSVPQQAPTVPHNNCQVRSPARNGIECKQQTSVDDISEMTNNRANYRPEYAAFLSEMCSIVDRYWNGSGSLHKHQKFQALANSLIGAFLERQMNQESCMRENRRLEDENHRLRQSLNVDSNVDIRETLNDARKDVELLRDKLKKTYDENQILQDKLDAMKKSSLNSTNTSITAAELERQKRELENEVSSLKRRIHEMEKVHQLTAMVQEAHKSLLCSNDQLRKELEDTRQRHNADVEQLHWSYNQLKKSTSGLGTSGLGNLSLDLSHRSQTGGHNLNRNVNGLDLEINGGII